MLLKSRKPIFFWFFQKKVYLPRCKRRGEGTEKVSNFWEDLGYHHFEVGFKLESHINRMFGERKRPFSRKVLLASLHFFIFFFNPFLSFLSSLWCCCCCCHVLDPVMDHFTQLCHSTHFMSFFQQVFSGFKKTGECKNMNGVTEWYWSCHRWHVRTHSFTHTHTLSLSPFLI